jgi:hypothetical protein
VLREIIGRLDKKLIGNTEDDRRKTLLVLTKVGSNAFG